MQTETSHTGSCACKAVQFTAHGQPLRVGLCHCLTCRKHHAAAFNPFVVFPRDGVTITGPLRAWRSSGHATRLSCQVCSSPICQQEDDGDEIELHLGSFDHTSRFTPQYENWIKYREAWLPRLGLPGNVTDRGTEVRAALQD